MADHQTQLPIEPAAPPAAADGNAADRTIDISLPDGSVRQYPAPVTGAAVAASIGPGLAKAALAIRVDGALRDLARPIEADAAVEIVTIKDGDALELIRHDAAHVLAEAVQELYPGTQITFGPGDRRRFLLRFPSDRTLHAGRFCGDRGEDARDRRPG